MINALSLIVKHYIYVTRCAQKIPTVENCERYVKDMINLERNVAISKGKLEAHNIKWRDLNC